MAQSGFTPIQLYHTDTPSATPSTGNLAAGEIALNTADLKIYAKNAGGSLIQVASGPSATDTLTNKTISGANNTLSNIGNSSLTNSAITFGSTAQALGSTVSALNGVSIGATTASTGAFTNLSYTGTLTGGTGVINIGSGQLYKDASGNVGIGTSSPAAKLVSAGSESTVFKALILRNGNGTDGSSATIDFEASAGTQGAEASMVGRIAGLRTGSGTSGALTFSTTNAGVLAERMRIDSAGRLLVGTASNINSYLTQIASTASDALSLSRFVAAAGGTELALTKSRSGTVGTNTIVQNGDTLGTITFRGADGASYIQSASISALATGTIGTGVMPGTLTFATTPAGSGGPSERMRIDSAGNVGIGTSSPSQRLHVEGNALIARPFGSSAFLQIFQSGVESWQILNPANSQALTFANSGTERMRIDSSGNLLVGTTTANGKLYVTGLTNSVCARFEAAGGIVGALVQCVNTSTSGTNTAIFFQQNGSAVGSITTSNTTTTYNTSSDYRLKHDIQPMTGALAKVQQLKPVTYKWNADDSESQGFIAHELQEVVPECVTGEKDAVDEEGKPVYQGIDTSFLVATLTAALQEAVAEINSLKARLDAANL
jgi:hypothetical protein